MFCVDLPSISDSSAAMVLGPMSGTQEYLCRWLGHMRLSRIVILVVSVLLFVPLITHYYLSRVENAISSLNSHRSRSQLETFDDYSSLKASDLRLRVDELTRIKNSVSAELRDLEARRQKLQADVTAHTHHIDQLKQELLHQQTDLDRLKISVEQAQVAHHEALQRNTPELALPRQLTADTFPAILEPISVKAAKSCRMHNCFDYSRCSLTSGFPVYLYETDVYSVVKPELDVDGFLKTTLKQALNYNPHLTKDPKEACIFLVLVGEALPKTSDLNVSVIIDTSALHNLPYWGGDGRNHVLLNLARRDLSIGSGDAFRHVDTGRALLVQSTFTHSRFRPNFDLIVPPMLGPPGGDVWQECPSMLPARRKYLLSFQGEIKPVQETMHKAHGTNQYFADEYNELSDTENIKNLDAFILEHLREMSLGGTSDKFYLQFECVPASDEKGYPAIEDWSLCGTDSSRKAVLRESTFVLILAPSPADLVSTTLLQARIYEGLRSGAIPVILGGDQVLLSYFEVVAWKRACLFLPKARITELHFLLRSVTDADLLSMRRQGRFIWERYLSSVQSTVDVIIAILRDRLGIPAKPVEDIPAISVFNATFQPLQTDVIAQEAEPEESLGPIEPPYASPSFKRNYTLSLMQSYEIWNDWADPFHLYPQLPFDTILPSDAKFMGSGTGFRPIGKGAGGAGKEFCEALGGNNPREQFTVVMLTYEREQVLINSIGRLRGLPYLNKVVVIWNSPRPPLEDLRWPDIGAPVHVIKATRNSLNNRFLPLDIIETEAVLSVDDDAHLRHDEIIFGFRVWREHRDRVVGFPGRFHAWDLNHHDGWLYNSNYSCEFSMVLTGAAFVHKYYMYLYWYWLPQAIRDKVDEYMNCEDIAMNFLVSHITRKPPVKVTSRWTFRCPGCPVSLSEDDTHFQERHKCINFFTQVFGYTPLLNTQYRADSILFKTRIPHDKQKCFKFI